MQKTNVIGYFNPNEYPLQLSLAEHNMVIQLEPKQYVVDRTGRLVNDPVLDRFVGKGRLARASDQKQQVEFTLLRPVNDPSTVAPAPHQHPVSQASRFETKDGRVTAVNQVNTAPQVATPPPQSYNPVRGMTVEQAKALRLIKPTKPVPEDYGAEEGTGAPKAGQEIPTIKYATDSVRGRKPAPLPAELAQPATPQQAAIIQGLERAASVNPEDPDLLSQVARVAVTETVQAPPQGMPPTTAFPKPQLDESNVQPPPVPQAPPTRISAPPIPTNPTPTVITPLPPPPQEEDEGGLVVEDELPSVSGEAQPEDAPPHDVEVEDRVEEARRPAPPAKIGTIPCPKCQGKTFATVGLFLRHVRRFHGNQESELMAPYASA